MNDEEDRGKSRSDAVVEQIDDIMEECLEAKDKALMLAQSLWACGIGEVETKPSFYFGMARIMEEIGNTLDKAQKFIQKTADPGKASKNGPKENEKK